MHTILFISGTRPEVIKLAPVYLAMKSLDKLITRVWISTDQHREMLQQALEVFGIKPDLHLNIMQPNQSLTGLAAAVMTELSKAFSNLKADLVIVQGDTTTAFASATAAFYHHIPVAHVEAGLRSFDLHNPFPEEANRQMISVLGTIHFAPTILAATNLRNAGISSDYILVTGNTVVDALNL